MKDVRMSMLVIVSPTFYFDCLKTCLSTNLKIDYRIAMIRYLEERYYTKLHLKTQLISMILLSKIDGA